MTNLGGHDMAAIVEAFDEAAKTDRPTCFVAYTVKGWGLPFAGHKDNHSGLMNEAQMEAFRSSQGIVPGEEWEPFAGLDAAGAERLHGFIERAPFRRRLTETRKPAPVLPMPRLSLPGRRDDVDAGGLRPADAGAGASPAARSPSAWSPPRPTSPSRPISAAGSIRSASSPIRPHSDVFRDRKLLSAQKWVRSLEGRHIELGIAENNLFLLLAALGLAEPLFGQRLLPVGTVYDPFISRGLDALNYACYQDARFLLVATPSGITLAPEGGAHQSIIAPADRPRPAGPHHVRARLRR